MDNFSNFAACLQVTPRQLASVQKYTHIVIVELMEALDMCPRRSWMSGVYVRVIFLHDYQVMYNTAVFINNGIIRPKTYTKQNLLERSF
jgi:hypothetical protein